MQSKIQLSVEDVLMSLYHEECHNIVCLTHMFVTFGNSLENRDACDVV